MCSSIATVHDRGPGLRPSLYAGSVCDDSAAEAAYAAIVALGNELYPLLFQRGSKSSMKYPKTRSL